MNAMKKESYLSIGEAARIMNVHIKSLRYYDRIGVLPPAYVDEETGYRYYAPSQLSMIQAIQFCVELGIPLRSFTEYCRDGNIDAERLIEDAGRIAEQKIRSIRNGLRFVEEMRETVRRGDRLLSSVGPMEYETPTRCYIVHAVEKQCNDMEFNCLLGQMHSEAAEQGFQTGFSYGYLYLYEAGDCRRYVYTEVYGDGHPDKRFLSFPAGRCCSVLCEESRIEHARELFTEEFNAGQGLTVFESEVITGIYNTEKPYYELRCFTPFS